MSSDAIRLAEAIKLPTKEGYQALEGSLCLKDGLEFILVPKEEWESMKSTIQELKDQQERDRAAFQFFRKGHNQFAQRITSQIDQLFEATEKKAQPIQKDRADILRALLAANGGKMLAKDARQKMRLPKSRFSELLSTMKDLIEVKPYHLNRSKNIIILK